MKKTAYISCFNYTMDTFEERNNQAAAEQRLFSGSPSEDELDETRRKSPLKQPADSSDISVAPGEKRPQKPETQGSLIIQSKAAEHYTNGKKAMGLFQFEKAVICFAKALTLQPHHTELYVRQAEAYLQLCDFLSAAACYKQASLQQPGAFSARLAFIYYLQGQCLFDEGLFPEALEAFSKAAEIKPNCRAYKTRSLACLTAAGHHTDCLKQVNDWMESDGPTSDLYVLRARIHKLLNQTLRCYQDVKLAMALNPACPQARALLLQLQQTSEWARQKAVSSALTGQLPEALRMINIALENCPQEGHLLLFRGILYRRLKDFTAAIEDLVHAVELCEEEEGQGEVRGQAEARSKQDDCDSVMEEAQFQLVLTYNDFAVQCYSRGLYAEATLLLNQAIEEEKNQAGLYLNRGDCFFKQGDWCYALADYQQAEEMMRPDDPAVRLRLAVIYNTLGSFCFQDGQFQEATDMFSLAIHYNPKTGQYYENRSKAFRKLVNLECARRDFICMLILDPTNEELPPMLMNLFPGNSVSDVLSSSAGQAVRAELMDKIQACSSSSDQQRLSEEFQMMTLTKKDTASQSEEPPEAGKELLCLNQQKTQISVKSLLEVLMGQITFCNTKRVKQNKPHD